MIWKAVVNTTIFTLIGFLTLGNCSDVNVCETFGGEFSYSGTEKDSIARTFSKAGCEKRKGTLIIRTPGTRLPFTSGKRQCRDGHWLKLKVGDRKEQEICFLSRGDCFILQEDFYPCADLSHLKDCSVLKWQVNTTHPMYPVSITFKREDNSQALSKFRINYSYRQCAEETTLTESKTSETTSEITTTNENHHESIIGSRGLTESRNTGFSVYQALTLVLAILLVLITTALIGLTIRYRRTRNSKYDQAHPITPEDGNYCVVDVDAAETIQISGEKNSEALKVMHRSGDGTECDTDGYCVPIELLKDEPGYIEPTTLNHFGAQELGDLIKDSEYECCEYSTINNGEKSGDN